MKNEVFFAIALRIIILFALGMAATYIPEHLRDFFGDSPCKKCDDFSIMDEGYDWGVRHYWYAWMTFFLFILSCTNIVMQIDIIYKKHYQEE